MSIDDLKVMLADQTKLSALAEMAEKARLSKMEMNGKSFNESFFQQIKHIIRN